MKSPQIPIKNENGLQFVISWSITLKIELWAPYTHWQTVLKGEVILRQKAYFSPDYCRLHSLAKEGIFLEIIAQIFSKLNICC